MTIPAQSACSTPLRFTALAGSVGALLAWPAHAGLITGEDTAGFRTGTFTLDMGLGSLMFTGGGYSSYPNYSFSTRVQTGASTEMVFGPAFDEGALIDESETYAVGDQLLWNRWQSGYTYSYSYSCGSWGRYTCHGYGTAITGSGVDGTWAGNPNGYLAFRFDDNGWHYGWVELSIRDSAYDVGRWAYETEAGVGVRAGSAVSLAAQTVPEPDTLALLAMGAAGLAGYRRRRG